MWWLILFSCKNRLFIYLCLLLISESPSVHRWATKSGSDPKLSNCFQRALQGKQNKTGDIISVKFKDERFQKNISHLAAAFQPSWGLFLSVIVSRGLILSAVKSRAVLHNMSGPGLFPPLLFLPGPSCSQRKEAPDGRAAAAEGGVLGWHKGQTAGSLTESVPDGSLAQN